MSELGWFLDQVKGVLKDSNPGQLVLKRLLRVIEPQTGRQIRLDTDEETVQAAEKIVEHFRSTLEERDVKKLCNRHPVAVLDYALPNEYEWEQSDAVDEQLSIFETLLSLLAPISFRVRRQNQVMQYAKRAAAGNGSRGNCQVNVFDSRAAASVLARGLKVPPDLADATDLGSGMGALSNVQPSDGDNSQPIGALRRIQAGAGCGWEENGVRDRDQETITGLQLSLGAARPSAGSVNDKLETAATQFKIYFMLSSDSEHPFDELKKQLPKLLIAVCNPDSKTTSYNENVLNAVHSVVGKIGRKRSLR